MAHPGVTLSKVGDAMSAVRTYENAFPSGAAYDYFISEDGHVVKSAKDLRKELKKAEKAERRRKAAEAKREAQRKRAKKNLERIAKGDNDAAFDAARYLYEGA